MRDEPPGINTRKRGVLRRMGLGAILAGSLPRLGSDDAWADGATSRCPIRLLCLGDSLTAGDEALETGHRSYRGRLHALLIAEGYSIDFVGSQKLPPAVGGDPDHEGYNGAYIGPGGSSNTIADRLPAILMATPADIVIAAFGWNSVYNEPALAADKYRSLVQQLIERLPQADIVVATLSPQRGETAHETERRLPGYARLNSAARLLVSRSGTGRLHLTDFATAGFRWSDYHDVVHWSQPGADRAAKVLLSTLTAGVLRQEPASGQKPCAGSR